MPTTVIDELKTVVSAETSAFVANMKKAEGASASFSKQEKETQKVLRERASVVKDALANPLGAARGGIDKLAGSLGLSAKSAGILGAGIGTAAAAGGLLVKALLAGRQYAAEQTGKFADLAEEMRRTSRVNVFASSADGIDALAGKLATVRAQMAQAKQTREAADPFNYGGGIVGGTKTVLAQAAQAKADLLAEIPANIRNALGMAAKVVAPGLGNAFEGVDKAGYSSADRQRDAAAILDGQEKVAAKERAKLARDLTDASARELEITRLSIAGARTQVELTRSRLAYEREAASLHEQGVTDPQAFRDLDRRQSLDRRAIKARGRGDYLSALTDNVVATAAPGMGQGLERAQRARMGLQAQYNTADAAGGMFKTERTRWQTRLQEADNTVRAEQLSLRQRQDSLKAAGLEIVRQRSLVDLTHQDLAARIKRADLDVQAAELAKSQTFTLEGHLRAEERLKKAVAARAALETQAVVTQRIQSDLAYSAALRLSAIAGTNRSDLSKRAGSNEEAMRAARVEMSLPGISTDRRRELMLQLRGGENERREMLQERAFGKSPGQIQAELHREQMVKIEKDKFDKRMAATDGLFNVHRDMSGRILSGTDYLTGERRAPNWARSTPTVDRGGLTEKQLNAVTAIRKEQGGVAARADTAGLQSGGLTTGGLSSPATPTVSVARMSTGNQNDQKAGSTIHDTVRAILQALNITNQYQKTQTEILPQLAWGS